MPVDWESEPVKLFVKGYFPNGIDEAQKKVIERSVGLYNSGVVEAGTKARRNLRPLCQGEHALTPDVDYLMDMTSSIATATKGVRTRGGINPISFNNITDLPKAGR